MNPIDVASPLLGAAAMLAVGLATGLPEAVGWPVFALVIAVCALVMRLAGPVPGVLASAAVHGLLTRGGRSPSRTADRAAAVTLYALLALTALSLALLLARLVA
ncbi:MAG: hypothetical protein R3F39_20475 [Myxococcota bacterium]